MSTCFVMQPFDGGSYDKRYRDVFEPAIRAAGLEPYRVDQDPTVEIPILEIENGIKRAAVCLAEISTDNPNVWYELGYAIASGRDVVLVCCEGRGTKFPFDIQHRRIISYKSESSSDFEKLANEITERLKAIIRRREEIGDIIEEASISETEGLKQYEFVTLVTAAQSLSTPDTSIPAWDLREKVQSAGFTEIAVTLAMRGLVRKGFLEELIDSDWNGNDYCAFKVKAAGLDWLEDNQDKLILKREGQDNRDEVAVTTYDEKDDLPF